ncbi:MAG: hypothetical protein LAT76_12970, partial [Schleiferiaceae bacterium]|nr:hypothetical protein [Schleiferiaceae bacterium]
NDQINVFMSAQKSPMPFEPEVGLMRRRNFEEFFATAGWRPRPSPTSWWRWIRQWDINPGEFTYTIYNDTRALQTFLWTVRPFGFSTRSGEYFAVQVEHSAEGLIEDFNIRSDEVVIPKGEYWFTRYSINGNSFASRFISGRFRISSGQFFEGTRTEQYYETRIRASKYLSISAVVEQNDVQLPQGSFTTTLFGNRLEYAFNPNLFGLVFTQWNNDQELLILNYRLQWIPIIGADFFLIINHVVKTGNTEWVPQQTAVIGKLIWRFAI